MEARRVVFLIPLILVTGSAALGVAASNEYADSTFYNELDAMLNDQNLPAKGARVPAPHLVNLCK